jgi:hypothetical protein
VTIGRAATTLFLAALATGPVRALETDQFYAWTRPLEDATDAINTKVNAEIDAAIANVNARRGGKDCACRVVLHAIRDRFDYVIISRPEIWASQTSAIARIPVNGDEEPRYRREYIYGTTSRIDPLLWMPPSPTIEAAGVRFGTDKLGHLLSDGAWTELSYRLALREGASEDRAMATAIRYSIETESTIWGRGSSGIFSRADLEANYQGLLFYRGLCDGGDPQLVHGSGGWRLKRPFDLSAYVTPEWDESWQANIYTRRRWDNVKPVMAKHCPELLNSAVQRRREAYAARDRETPTEAAVAKLVAAGKLEDPWQFSIEAVCDAGPQPELTPPRASAP